MSRWRRFDPAKTYGKFVVYVQDENDEGFSIFGVYESKESAQRKADAINKRIEAAGLEVSWAHVARLHAGTTNADLIVEAARLNS